MIIGSVPEILKNESLFATAAQEAADHVMKQPETIRQPIALYGGMLMAGEPTGRIVLVDFIRALREANVQQWTKQLSDPLYRKELDRLEDTIAEKVYQAHVARNLDIVERRKV